MVDMRSFEKRYMKRTKALMSIAAAAKEEPSPEEIHDLRVTIRRIQAMNKLLPKKIRLSDKQQKYQSDLRDLLKSTSRVRDLDILRQTLKQFQESLPRDVFEGLSAKRQREGSSVSKAVSRFLKGPKPKIYLQEVNQRKITYRLDNKINSRVDVCRVFLRKATDENRTEEIHHLRINLKKLRYLLEINSEQSSLVEWLTTWQDMLGEVHDLEVAKSYLKGLGMGNSESVMTELSERKRLAFLGFKQAAMNNDRLAAILS